MGLSSIEWTSRTLNPGVYGCELVSPACTHCYAMGMSHRHTAQGLAPEGITRVPTPGRGPVWTGKVVVRYERIAAAFAALPKKPRKDGQPIRVFVTSMADLFHKDVPDDFIDRVFVEMERRPWMTFQVLTKRIERVPTWWETRATYAPEGMPAWPANVWMGTTVEDQRRADERIPHLLRVPASVRFLSVEPMVGPVDLDPLWCDSCDYAGRSATEHVVFEPPSQPWCTECDREVGSPGWLSSVPGIDWVIAGGESGQKARPSDPAWFRALRDQCKAAGVPFFMKQMSGHKGADKAAIPEDLMVREFPEVTS
jgi:protein gp37